MYGEVHLIAHNILFIFNCLPFQLPYTYCHWVPVTLTLTHVYVGFLIVQLLLVCVILSPWLLVFNSTVEKMVQTGKDVVRQQGGDADDVR